VGSVLRVSSRNARFQQWQALLGNRNKRQRAGEFLVQGVRPITLAARFGWRFRALIHDDSRPLSQWAQALLRDAAATLDDVTRRPKDAQAAARGSIAVAQAKAFASEVAVEVASDLFALSGASAADERHDLSRHWRNARTHASHDPADWKYHHVGNFLLNNVPPPNHGQV